MVSFTLKFMFLLIVVMAAVQYKIEVIIHPPQVKVVPRQIEVGKTLATWRMNRYGLTGDWHQYTTEKWYGLV